MTWKNYAYIAAGLIVIVYAYLRYRFPYSKLTAIIRDLDLKKPIYRQLAAYGHMGREDLGVKWEQTDRIDALRAAVQ